MEPKIFTKEVVEPIIKKVDDESLYLLFLVNVTFYKQIKKLWNTGVRKHPIEIAQECFDKTTPENIWILKYPNLWKEVAYIGDKFLSWKNIEEDEDYIDNDILKDVITIHELELSNMPKLKRIGANFGTLCQGLRKIVIRDMPKLKTIGDNFCRILHNLISVEFRNLPKLTNMGNYIFTDSRCLKSITYYNCPNVEIHKPDFVNTLQRINVYNKEKSNDICKKCSYLRKDVEVDFSADKYYEDNYSKLPYNVLVSETRENIYPKKFLEVTKEDFVKMSLEQSELEYN